MKVGISKDQVLAIVRLLRLGRTPVTIAQDMGVSVRSVAAAILRAQLGIPVRLDAAAENPPAAGNSG